MYWSVIKAKALSDYRLELTFEGGTIRIFDAKPYFGTGEFKALQDESFFKRVKVAFGSVEWPNGVDLDPEVLYAESKARNRKIACVQ